MPSAKKQFGARPDEETQARIDSLKVRVAAALGLAKVSDSVLLRLAMIELEKKYPPETKSKGK